MYEYIAKVFRVVDADTLELDVDLGFRVTMRMVVRLDGIDAIERTDSRHKQVIDWLRFNLEGEGPIRIKTKKDRKEKYGRYLVELFYATDELSINEQMVRAGYAKPYNGGKRG